MFRAFVIIISLVCLLFLSYANFDQAASAAPAAQSITYPLVDTAQTACYDDSGPAITCPTAGQAFYGQDAHFNGNQPDYIVSNDGLTIYDNVTGLTWTQSPDWNSDGTIDVDDKMTFAEAQGYPNTLNAANFGSYSDWRLPTIKELYSLMDFRGTDPSGPNPTNPTPFIDTAYFEFGYGDESADERIIDAQFWSSNTYLGTVFGSQTCAFGLNLADGRIKCYPSASSGPVSSKLNYVYFVRGNTSYGINNFTDNGDGTITDNATGLMWSQNDSGTGMTWTDALAWVQQKNAANYLGYNDWRLPSAKEMQSILDYSRAPDATSSAAIDPVFNITQITNEDGQVDYPWFSTGTTFLRADGSASNAVYIAFGRGLGSMDNVNVIDVHGAGCQRSDPKTGNANDYPTWGNGPQGDVRRVFNYVRLVRDGAAQFVEGAGFGADASTQPAADNQPAGGNGQPAGDGPPQEAINACSGLSENTTCQFTTPRGNVSGTCLAIAGQLACAPELYPTPVDGSQL